ncbi:hypothetical protein PENTCL1PPCAC_7903, partial [Pristionchus entomophagus]
QPPWSSALARVASNDTFNDEVNDILPKKFKSKVSTRTEATMESMSSGYHYSQEILDGEEGEEEIVEEEDESSAERGRYAIVEDSCLSRLFKRCQECGELLDHSLTERRRCGSALVVITECLACNKKVQWDSQEKVGIGRGQAYSLNHRIPISAFITGTPLPRLCDFARTLDLDFPSDRSMRKTIREIGSVAIERVYAGWEETVREVVVNASEGDGLQVSIDGQYDSPGFTSSNCKVTTIDCHTKLAISGVALSKKEDGIDGVSIRLESEGALRALVDLVNHNIPIKKLVSDQNAMVMKKLREHPKTAHIERKLDWWHVQKHMRKEWWKMVKANPKLAPVYQMFFNHLYFVHHKYPRREDRPRALELVQSFIMHIQGKYSWKKNDEFKVVTRCEHGKLKAKKRGESRVTLEAGSEALESIHEMLFAPRFSKAFLSSASLIDTSINECFHSLSLISPFYYKLKMLISIMHYNCLMLDDLLGERDEIGNTVLSRRGRLVLAIKRKKALGTHTWRDEIMKESVKVREELSDARVAKLIGIPSDDIFDDLTKWWEEKETWFGMEEEAEEEEEEAMG